MRISPKTVAVVGLVAPVAAAVVVFAMRPIFPPGTPGVDPCLFIMLGVLFFLAAWLFRCLDRCPSEPGEGFSECERNCLTLYAVLQIIGLVLGTLYCLLSDGGGGIAGL